jgi:hypothetical protein
MSRVAESQCEIPELIEYEILQLAISLVSIFQLSDTKADIDFTFVRLLVAARCDNKRPLISTSSSLLWQNG